MCKYFNTVSKISSDDLRDKLNTWNHDGDETDSELIGALINVLDIIMDIERKIADMEDKP